jgi:hypothetical protein
MQGPVMVCGSRTLQMVLRASHAYPNNSHLLRDLLGYSGLSRYHTGKYSFDFVYGSPLKSGEAFNVIFIFNGDSSCNYLFNRKIPAPTNIINRFKQYPE